jgi:hypothetical protein
VRNLGADDALALGGWDERYARVLATAVWGDVAAAIVDSNGDGADIDLDLYEWVGNIWQRTISGNVSDDGSGYMGGIVYLFGRATPGTTVRVDHNTTVESVDVSSDGWWLYLASASDEPGDAMPRLADLPGHPRRRSRRRAAM